MNFFYHNDDPLLSHYKNNINPYDNQISDAYANLYRQQLMQQPQPNNELLKDWVGELDYKMKNLQPEVVKELNKNDEFMQLNKIIQNEIQSEIMSIVKFKLNSSQNIQNNIKRQLEIINEVSEHTYDEERRNISELNDYVKNYSHLTFDEYKRIKNGENIKSNKKTEVKNDKG